jgi:penicillin-binding protein 2
LARAFAAIANGGRLITPHVIVEEQPSASFDLDLDPAQLATVTRALELVVHGEYGTARSLSPLPIAGKTGTAQVVRLTDGVDSEDLAPHLQHHAWFVGWAPLEDPEIVVSVVVEHGGGGGSVAAPAARKVFAAALDDGTRTAPSGAAGE